MKRVFQYDCCRCGMCCLTVTCTIGQAFYRVDSATQCPGLQFRGKGVACCSLVALRLVPIGDGCCIKARAYRDGVEYDFASLPVELKRKAVEQVRRAK